MGGTVDGIWKNVGYMDGVWDGGSGFVIDVYTHQG